MVAGAGRRDLAAIASPACAEIYGLQPLQGARAERAWQLHPLYLHRGKARGPGAPTGRAASRHALQRTRQPLSGAGRIYGRGINLTKLESRPIPGSDDTFRFYFDLEASVYSPELPKPSASWNPSANTSAISQIILPALGDQRRQTGELDGPIDLCRWENNVI